MVTQYTDLSGRSLLNVTRLHGTQVNGISGIPVRVTYYLRRLLQTNYQEHYVLMSYIKFHQNRTKMWKLWAEINLHPKVK
jgi:hypothetical protein